MSRWTKFLIAIVLGAAAGLFYGWVVNPVEYVDISPQSLRADYKSDFVLMVAESYQVDQDTGLAVKRLALLGTSAPTEIVAGALDYGLKHGYAAQDLSLLQSLGETVGNWNPNLEISTP
ncbi:MAG TPA: hypothetical protein VLD65_02175 [Anaerolineales bacterium]|nr:hypothetical protein [Anaerolineales bacterium]